MIKPSVSSPERKFKFLPLIKKSNKLFNKKMQTEPDESPSPRHSPAVINIQHIDSKNKPIHHTDHHGTVRHDILSHHNSKFDSPQTKSPAKEKLTALIGNTEKRSGEPSPMRSDAHPSVSRYQYLTKKTNQTFNQEKQKETIKVKESATSKSWLSPIALKPKLILPKISNSPPRLTKISVTERHKEAFHSQRDDSIEDLINRAMLTLPENDLDNVILMKKDVNTTRLEDYKNIFKILEEPNHPKRNEASVNMLVTSVEKRLLPISFGIQEGIAKSQSVLNLKHYNMLDRYGQVLAEGVKLMPKVAHANLANNGLTARGANKIFENINPRLKTLDASLNRLGPEGCRFLNNTFFEERVGLMELNLEGNKVGDLAVIEMFNSLRNNTDLRKLNLSRNRLSDRCSIALEEMLARNDVMHELYLHYNLIQGEGCARIFSGLKKNTTLKVIDLSWNGMGNSERAGKAMSEFFIQNKTLLHADFSYNKISYDVTAMVAKGLEENHTLYGLHWMGNDGYIDSDGYLIPIRRSLDIANVELTISQGKLRIDGLKCIVDRRFEENLTPDNCWICEGFQEVRFQYAAGKTGEASEDPIYVHWDFDNFLGCNMKKVSQGFFEHSKMVPPGIRHYFFSAKKEAFLGQDKPMTHINHHRDYKVATIILSKLQMQIGKDHYVVTLENLNYCKTLGPFDEKNFDFTIPGVQPRVRIAEEIKKKPWTFPESVFRDYKKEDEELLRKCFEFDMASSKIPRVAKDPEEYQKIEALLWTKYREIKDTYKYYSAIGLAGDIFAIPVNSFTEFLNHSGMVDGKLLKLSDVDILFITTNAGSVKAPFNPDRSLVRYQFMEIMVRIAVDKFFKTKTAQSTSQAVTSLFDDTLIKSISMYNNQNWRETQLWNEPCDIVYMAYMPLLKELYNRYSGARSKPGFKKAMCVDELKKMCSDCDLFVDTFQDREVNVVFNCAIMLQIDELNVDRHLQMQFVEFIEAFARIAEKSALVFKNENKHETYAKRAALPLQYKIEGLFERTYKTCLSNIMGESFSLPEVSLFGDVVL